jgi:hypothetical protein
MKEKTVVPMPFYDPSLYYSLRARQSPSGSPAAAEIQKVPARGRPEGRPDRRETHRGSEVTLLALSAGSFLLTAGYLAYAMVMRFA